MKDKHGHFPDKVLVLWQGPGTFYLWSPTVSNRYLILNKNLVNRPFLA